MKLKYWIEVIEKSEPIYSIVEEFIKDGCGQPEGYSRKSGNNEKEHCILHWETKNLEKDYDCTQLWCHEMLLHIAASFSVSGEDLKFLDRMAREYVSKHGPDMKRVSPIAADTMDLIKKTETYKHYDSLE